MTQRRPKRTVPRIEELEPRILFSADVATALVDLRAAWDASEAEPAWQSQLAVGPSVTDSSSAARPGADSERAMADQMLRSLGGNEDAAGTGEIVFIDGSVSNLDELLASLDPRTERVILDSSQDGLAQMAASLEGRSGLRAIHVLSEGTSGSIQLGNSWLDLGGIGARADDLARVGAALAPEGDLLIYGCETAAGEQGGQFIAELARLTQADVASSVDLTGARSLGGNWELERQIGQIQAATVLNAQSGAAYEGVLGNYLVTSTADSGAGTFRQAILDANANGGTDAIIFNIGGGGAQTIALSTALPVINSVVFIDATQQPGYTDAPLITITGSGVLNANGLELHSGASGSSIIGLVINGFNYHGIHLISAANVTIQGNYIGTDSAGTADAGNNENGIQIEGNSSGAIIGGALATQRNLISGNGQNGINVRDQSNSVVIQGNYIGLDRTGTVAIGNALIGVDLWTAWGTIGGALAGEGNVISANGHSGVHLAAPADGTVVQGNRVGVDATGTVVFGNGWSGIDVQSDGNTLGGAAAGAGNVVSGNGQGGLALNSSSNNTIAGNLIGLNAAGTGALFNNWFGIELFNSSNSNTIGGTTAGAGNTVATASGQNGILINGSSGMVIQGNRLGTNLAGTAALGIGGSGLVFANNSSNSTVGGSTAAAANIIADANYGIYIDRSVNIVVQGNYVGTNASGTNLGNRSHGILFDLNSTDNVIGGTNAGEGNTIAFNAGGGIVTVDNGSLVRNRFLGNSIRSNGQLGIDLGNNGVTANDVGDADTGTNNYQNFPVLTSATKIGSTTAVVGTFNATASRTYRIEFFANTAADSSGHGEGQRYLGFVDVTTNGSGSASFSPTLASATTAGEWLSATATDLSSNETSEFAQSVQVVAPSSAPTGADKTVSLSQSSTYTFSVADFGFSDAGDSPANAFTSVKISGFIGAGVLTNNGVVVNDGDVVQTSDIALNRLVFSTNTSGSSGAYASFLFQVADNGSTANGGATMDTSPKQMTVAVTPANSAASINYVVTNTANSGAGSLRQAIIDANTTAGADTISFNIGVGLKTINLSSALPDITGLVAIDGTSQSGYTNSPLIEILGNSGAVSNAFNFVAGSAGSSLKGFVVGGFGDNAVNIKNTSNITVQGNYIGVNAAGLNSSAHRNTNSALYIENSSNVTIGGSTAAARNVLSGNNFGVALRGSTGAVVQGNYIGPNAANTGTIGNFYAGVFIDTSSNNLIGGTAAGEGNIITGADTGIATTDNASIGNRFLGNLLYNNTASDIDLFHNGNGLTLNDPGDIDSVGANHLQNFPVISGAYSNATQTIVQGTLNSTASRTFRLEFFSSPNHDSTGYGDAQSYLGFVDVTTDTNGDASYSATFSGRPDGQWITGTATDLTAQETSEFSLSVQAVATNDAPSGTSGTVTTLEDTPYVFSAADFGFSDVDGNSLAVVHIDSLPTQGTLRYNGSTLSAPNFVSVSDLSQGNLTYLPNANLNGAAMDSFLFRVSDNGGTANGGLDTDAVAKTLTFNVTAVNDAPVVTASGGTTGYTENGAAVAIDSALTLADIDTATLASASVSLTGGFQSGEDVLAFSANAGTMGNITGSYDAATGVLSLSSTGATATLTQWETALRSVTYANSSDNPTTATRTVSFAVNDGSLSSSTSTKSLSVTAVNDAPVVTASGGTTGYTENGAAVVIDSALTLADLDNATLAAASVSLTSGFQSGQDLLAFSANAGTMGNITGSYDASTGVLSLSSTGATATLAQWETALRSVTYANSSDNPNTATRTVSFAVNDGSLSSTASTQNVSVTAVNDAPVVTASGGTTGYTENGAAVVIDSALTLADIDTATLASASVSLTGGFQSGQDMLAFSANASTMGNIAGSYDAATGVMSLTSSGGTATVAQWQAALRSVIYANSSDNPNTATRTVSFAVSDGSLSSTASTQNVSVTAVNDAPVVTASGGTTAYTENGAAVVIDSALTLADIDTATLASASVSVTGGFQSGQDLLAFSANAGTMGNIAGSYDASTGVMSLTSSGGTATVAQWETALRSVTYANSSDNPNTATRTVSFAVNDGSLSSTASTRNVSVTAVNDAPVVTASGGTTGYTENGAAVAIDSALTLADIDTATLASASVSLTGGFQSGQDVLAFSANASTMGNITGSYDAATGVMSLTSSGGTATVAQWQTALRSVTYANSSDNPNTATRTVSFAVNDGSLSSTASTQNVSVAAVNDAPVVTASGSTTAYTENGAAVVIDSALTLTDLDNTTLASASVSLSGGFQSGQDLLAFSANAGTMGNITGSYDAATGVLSLSSTGATATLAQWQTALRSVTYANSSDSPNTATRTVSFAVNDGSLSSTASTQNVSVTAVNDAPVVTASGGTTGYTENGAALAIDTGLTLLDADNATLASATVSITNGLQISQDVLALVANAGTMGNITGSYDASTGVMSLTSSGGTATVAQWQAALRSVTYTNSSDNPNTATRTVSFAVNDGSLGSTASTQNVSVAAVNDAPVVTNSGGTTAYTENGAPLVIDTGLTLLDADNATLASATVSITSGLQTSQDVLAFVANAGTMGNITGSYDAATGVMSLTSTGGTATVAQWQAALRAVTYANSSDNPNSATRTISFAVNDGSAGSTPSTKNLSVAAVNDAPVVTTSGGTTAYTENAAAVVIDSALTLADADDTTLGFATVRLTGGFQSGQDVLAFSANAGTMGNITASYNAATGLLSMSSSGATATLAQWQAALRSVTYANSADNPSTANRTVIFVVSDGRIGSNADVKNLSVAAVNDAPVVTNSGGTTAYTENGAAVLVDSALTLADIDTTTLASASVSLTGGFQSGQDVLAFSANAGTMGNITGSYDAATGVLSLSSTGATATLAQWQAALRAVTYANSSDTPSTATRTVSFVVNDGTAGSTPSTKNLSVAAVNDAPVLAGSSGSTDYTAWNNAQLIDPLLTISDADSASLASANVSIVSNFASGRDVLAFTHDGSTMGNITAVFQATTGVLTFNSAGASATLAQWQSALRAVTFSSPYSASSEVTRTVRFEVNDGTQPSAAMERALNLPANSMPIPLESDNVAKPASVRPAPPPAVVVADPPQEEAPAATPATQTQQPTVSPDSSTDRPAQNNGVIDLPSLIFQGRLPSWLPVADISRDSGAVREEMRSATNAPSEQQFSFLSFNYAAVIPSEWTVNARVPTFGGANFSSESQGRVSRDEEGAEAQVSGEISASPQAFALKASTLAVAGAAGFWSLRFAGLATSLFVTRPLWSHLDPIPLLPASDEDENDELTIPEVAGDIDAAHDDSAVESLFENIARKGTAS